MTFFTGVRLRSRHLALVASVAVIAYSIFFVGSVTAYVGQSKYRVSVSSASTRNCTGTVTIVATVTDFKTRKAISFQTVKWSISGRSSKDKVSPHASVTNSHGQARTTVKFGPAAGSRRVTASVGGFQSTGSATCSSAGPPPTHKPKPTPTSPDRTPKPTPKPTQRPAQSTPRPTPKPTKKPHHDPTPTPTATATAVAATLPAGGITPSPIGEASPSPASTLTAVVDSTGAPAATPNTAPLPDSDAGGGGGGGGGFDLGLMALLVIGALGALVVIFLVRQPTRARR